MPNISPARRMTLTGSRADGEPSSKLNTTDRAVSGRVCVVVVTVTTTPMYYRSRTIILEV
jgi:hypothetical protein